MNLEKMTIEELCTSNNISLEQFKSELIRRFSEQDEFINELGKYANGQKMSYEAGLEEQLKLRKRIIDLEQKLKEKDAETLISNIRHHLNTYEHCCDDCHKIDVMILEYEKLKSEEGG